MFERFEDIKAWQDGRSLNSDIFKITKKDDFSKDFSLKNQILKALNSIMLNIAEGFGRRSDREFQYFLFVAHGSVAEVQSALYIAFDRNYITNEEFESFYNKADNISRMISGLIKYLNKADEKRN